MLLSDERFRLESLRRLNVLDSPPEASFDRVAQLAARLFRAPISLVSLVGEHRQWFKACVGLNVCQTDRSVSFCAHAIESEGVLIVTDALQDPRFCNNALVTGDPWIRFYAGAPLVARDGAKLGTLCVIDTTARSDFSADDQATLQALAAIVVDALELRLASIRLREAQAEANADRRLLSEVFAALEEGVVVHDANGQIIAANESAERVLGLTRDQLLGCTSLDSRWRTVHPDGSALAGEDHPAMVALREARPVMDGLMGVERPDGERTWLSVNARPILEPGQSRTSMVVASFFNITHHRIAAKRLEYQAHHDVLTGLPNRASFVSRLEAALTELESSGAAAAAFAVGFLDLDGFKRVNDTYGHAFGDALLVQVAARLSSALRGSDMIARFGGDEFVLLLTGVHTNKAAARIDWGIHEALECPFEIDGHTVQVGVSVGLALCPRDGMTVEALLDTADRKMYLVKSRTTV